MKELELVTVQNSLYIYKMNLLGPIVSTGCSLISSDPGSDATPSEVTLTHLAALSAELFEWPSQTLLSIWLSLPTRIEAQET